MCVTLESLVRIGEKVREGLKYDNPPYNVTRLYDKYILEDDNDYYDWKELSLRYLCNNAPEAISSFIKYSIEFEKLYLPRYITNMISVLRACLKIPTEMQMRESYSHMVDDELRKLEELEMDYITLCNGGRDTCNFRETINAFHKWYSFASVLFDKIFYTNDDLCAKFSEVDTSGNGYNLYNEYKRINAVYCKLIARAKERKHVNFNPKGPIERYTMDSKIVNPIRIFISYAHADTKWLERLKTHLKVLKRYINIDYWEDTQIYTGSKWRDEISSAIERANVAILLVSTDFLASDFIANDELPPLLEKAELNGCRVMPLIVAPCAFGLSELSRYQAVNNPDTSLSDLGSNDAAVDRVFLDLMRDIMAI